MSPFDTISIVNLVINACLIMLYTTLYKLACTRIT